MHSPVRSKSAPTSWIYYKINLSFLAIVFLFAELRNLGFEGLVGYHNPWPLNPGCLNFLAICFHNCDLFLLRLDLRRLRHRTDE